MPKSDNQEREKLIVDLQNLAALRVDSGATWIDYDSLADFILQDRQQTRTALVEEVLREGPKDRYYSRHDLPEVALQIQSENRTNAEWRSILLKVKGDKS